MDIIDKFYNDKDLSHLKQLTIIIPTYNRNYYFSRCLWYHSHFPFGEIIVADSSIEEKKKVNQMVVNKINEIQGVNVRYLEYPPETEKYGGDIIRKWGDAIQYVKTDYSQFCTDKEFLNPMVLCKFVDFLNKKPGYNVVAGPRYDLKRNKMGSIEFYETYFGRSLSLDFPDPLARLLAFSLSKVDTYNISSMKRSNFHKYIYLKLLDSKINDLRFGELGLELLTIISSKSMYFLKEPHIYRDIIQYISAPRIRLYSLESSATRYPFLNEYIKNGMYYNNMKYLSHCLTQEFFKTAMSTMAFDEINLLMHAVIKNLQMVRGFFGNPNYQYYSLCRYIFDLLPVKLENYIRKLLDWPAQSPLDEISIEGQIIVYLISKTLHLHKNDDTISIKDN